MPYLTVNMRRSTEKYLLVILPPKMNDQMFIDFLGSVMESVRLHIMDGNPIPNCELFGKYTSIELRTPREATNVLNLNIIPSMGSILQMTRPSKRQGKWDKHSNWEHILVLIQHEDERNSAWSDHQSECRRCNPDHSK